MSVPIHILYSNTFDEWRLKNNELNDAVGILDDLNDTALPEGHTVIQTLASLHSSLGLVCDEIGITYEIDNDHNVVIQDFNEVYDGDKTSLLLAINDAYSRLNHIDAMAGAVSLETFNTNYTGDLANTSDATIVSVLNDHDTRIDFREAEITIDATTKNIGMGVDPHSTHKLDVSGSVNISSSTDIAGLTAITKTTQSTTTTSGALKVAGGVGIAKNLNVGGNIHATGSITSDGSVTLGDANTDNVVFGADVNSNIIPNTSTTYNLGSSTQQWNDVHVGGTSYLNNAVEIDATIKDVDLNNGELYIGSNDGAVSKTTLTAGEGIDITNAAGSIQIDAEIATSANKGVAKFSTDNFSVTEGLVTIKNNGIILATETTGDYVATGSTSGSGISGSTTGENKTFTVSSNATADNTASTIVFRDSDGSFNANVGTFNKVVSDSITIDGETISSAATKKISLEASTVVDIKANSQVVVETSKDGTNAWGNVDVTGNVNVSRNVDVQGNLTVSGALTSINSEEFNIADNNLLLNSNITEPDSPFTLINESGGITVKRFSNTIDSEGTPLSAYADNASFTWDEPSLMWNSSSMMSIDGVSLNELYQPKTYDDESTNVENTIQQFNNLVVFGSAPNLASAGQLILTSGTIDQRPTSAAAGLVAGCIRYNTELSTYEGYTGTAWGSLGGVVMDTDRDTYITAEGTADSDTIHMVASEQAIVDVYKDGDNAWGNVDVTGNIDVSKNGSVVGDFAVGGNLTVGGTTTTVNTETITIQDNIIVLNSNATEIPTENAGIEIERGNSDNASVLWIESDDYWKTSDQLRVDNLKFDGNTISTTNANGNLVLSANGTGVIDIDTKMDIDASVYIDGFLDVDNIKLDGNTITSTNTDGNINLNPNGTGAVDVNASKFNLDGVTTIEDSNLANGELYIGGGDSISRSTLTAGEGIDITNAAGSIQIDAEIATSANKGVAKFSTDNFSVTEGLVTIKNNGIILATETTGDYVATGATSGSGISGSTTGENTTFTVTSNATADNTASTIVFRNASNEFDISKINVSDSIDISKAVDAGSNNNLISLEGSLSDITADPVSVGIEFSIKDENNPKAVASIRNSVVNHDSPYGDDDEGASNLVFATANAGVVADQIVVTGRGYTGFGVLDPQARVDISGDIIVSGNLTVGGTTTTVNTETVSIQDNIIVLNSNAADIEIPIESAGIEVERGSVQDNSSIIWSEAVVDDVMHWRISDQLRVDNLKFDGNTINTTDANGNLQLSTNGTGRIDINAELYDNDLANGELYIGGAGNITKSTLSAGEGIDITNAAGSIQIDAEIATSANKGVAKFSTDNFLVTSGTVTIKNNGVSLGTETTGNYVKKGTTSGSGISGSVDSEGGTFTVTSNATADNTASTIVYRDASKNFSANKILVSELEGVTDISADNTTGGSHIELSGDQNDPTIKLKPQAGGTTPGVVEVYPNGNDNWYTHGGKIALKGGKNPGGASDFRYTDGTIAMDNNFMEFTTEAAGQGGGGFKFNTTITGTLFDGTATQAKYADLAENYQSDQEYEVGTVLSFGGDWEVTQSNKKVDTRIAGVVSTAPAYLMNSEQQGEFVIPVALTGRVPCKVQGDIQKGDMLVSAGNGRARVVETPLMGSVIGKALEDSSGDNIIEVVVGKL